MNANIIQRWRSEGIELNALATDLEFSICEIKVGFTFPEDFKRMYRIVNGFKSLNMDSRLLSLWPLDRIINEYPGLDFIPFSDYLANGSQCGFIKNQLGIFRNYNPNWVCKTFDEFIEHWESETGEYI